MRVALHVTALGNVPEGQALLFAGRVLDGIGSFQQDAECTMQQTTVGQLVADSVLDEVTRCGLPDSRVAWLYDNTGTNGEGVCMVLVEVTL